MDLRFTKNVRQKIVVKYLFPLGHVKFVMWPSLISNWQKKL